MDARPTFVFRLINKSNLQIFFLFPIHLMSPERMNAY